MTCQFEQRQWNMLSKMLNLYFKIILRGSFSINRIYVGSIVNIVKYTGCICYCQRNRIIMYIEERITLVIMMRQQHNT